jgi:hypothetical protein
VQKGCFACCIAGAMKRSRPGAKITRITEASLRLEDDKARPGLAFEAGRNGFWLARWLRARGVEAHLIHPSSVALSREHRRAKTDRRPYRPATIRWRVTYRSVLKTPASLLVAKNEASDASFVGT